ncbi:MAG: hypothetical protein ACK4M7_02665, partial [Burkholderiales bacterium]
MKLPTFNQPKFVLTIGDEGAVLTYIKAKKLELRIFATLNAPNDIKNMQRVLAEDLNAPIYVLLDVVDQSYTQQILPAVSVLAINNLVWRKLHRDFPVDDIKGSIYLSRLQKGRKDWQYMFVSCPLATPVKEWLAFVFEQPHQLASIHLLPVEMMGFLRQLNSLFFPKKLKFLKQKQEDSSSVKEKSLWQMLVTHDKVGGIRQVAFYNEKVVFTRMITLPSDLLPDIIAGHIEQELLNSFEYLKRLSLKEGEAVDLYIIVAQDIKRSLEASRLPGQHKLLFSPYEVANCLSLTNTATPEDRFADVVMAVSFANRRAILPLHTKASKQLLLFTKAMQFARWLAKGLAPILVCYMIFMGYTIYATQQEITKIEQEKLVIGSKWQQFQKENHYSMEDAAKISDVISLYKLLTGDNLSPLSLISRFAEQKQKRVLVKNIEWRLEDKLKNIPPQADKMSIMFDIE